MFHSNRDALSTKHHSLRRGHTTTVSRDLWHANWAVYQYFFQVFMVFNSYWYRWQQFRCHIQWDTKTSKFQKSTCVYVHPVKRVHIALQKHFVQGLEYIPNMLLITEVTAPKIPVHCQRSKTEILTRMFSPSTHEVQHLFESGIYSYLEGSINFLG